MANSFGVRNNIQEVLNHFWSARKISIVPFTVGSIDQLGQNELKF